MNRIITALMSGSIVLLLVSCNKEKDIAVTSVSITQATAEMYIGETVQLSATVMPSDATDKTVTWTSSKQSVATVSSTGKVTAIDEGVSTITASAGGKSSTCQVTVSKKVIAVTSVTLNKTTLELTEGDTETLVATVAPDNATDKTVTWSSTDATIAKVDNAGKVTAVKDGAVTIIAKAGEKTAACAVTVAKKVIPTGSIELNKSTLALVKGESETLVATVKPDDATDKTVTWSTSNDSVATVDQSGKVTAVGGGEATVTAKNGELSASCVVMVTVPVTSITLSKESLTIVEGKSETLTATVNPEDATDKKVTWATSDASIATVDNGLVTAIKEGTATVSVTSGEVSASCEVKVITPMDVAISFADSGIKAVLVDAFDTNHDGELSFREAAAVTSIEGVFGTNKSFTSFDEFQYFTGVTTIPHEMFSSWTMLKTIILPESISSIESFSFYRCESLTSIIIPNGVTFIGVYAFCECKSLPSILLPNNLDKLEERVFRDCNTLSSIEIPDKVTEIGRECFAGCTSLGSVKLPSYLRTIGESAFRDCAFASISLPERLRTIYDGAFLCCEKLTAIEIPEGVNSLYSTFWGCTSLVNVTLPETIIELNNTFTGCTSLTTIKLPKGIKSLHRAFAECSSLATISISNSVTNMTEAFRNCTSLTSIELPDEGYDYITFDGTFSGCTSLTSVTLPKKVRELNGTFSDCTNLTSVTISDKVYKIGENAFANCGKLASVDIPKSVSSVGYRAFINCSGLQEVVINNTSVPSGDYDMFLGSTCPIFVPAESLEKYKAASYWSEYADRFQAIGIIVPKSIQWSGRSNNGKVDFEFDTNNRLTKIAYNGYSDSFSYESYFDGNGVIYLKTLNNSYPMNMQNGLLGSIEGDYYTYSGRKVVKKIRNSEHYIEFYWENGNIVKLNYYIGGKLYVTTFEYGNTINPFTNQAINLPLFLIGRLEMDLFVELGFCGEQSAKLPTSFKTELEGIQTSLSTFSYEFDGSTLTKIVEKGNNDITYTFYY